VVTQPVIAANAVAAIATRGVKRRRRREAMGWFLLEALLALLIAVAIVMWTMGPRRTKPPRESSDTGEGEPR